MHTEAERRGRRGLFFPSRFYLFLPSHSIFSFLPFFSLFSLFSLVFFSFSIILPPPLFLVEAAAGAAADRVSRCMSVCGWRVGRMGVAELLSSALESRWGVDKTGLEYSCPSRSFFIFPFPPPWPSPPSSSSPSCISGRMAGLDWPAEAAPKCCPAKCTVGRQNQPSCCVVYIAV